MRDAHGATRRGEPSNPMTLFHLSNTYLALVFVAIAVDSVLGWIPLGAALLKGVSAQAACGTTLLA